MPIPLASLCTVDHRVSRDSSAHLDELVLDLQRSQPLMVHDLTRLSPVEAEVESHGRSERHDSHVEHEVRHVSVTVGIERIVAELVTIGLVMRVRLVDNQVSVRVRRKDVLVTIQVEK